MGSERVPDHNCEVPEATSWPSVLKIGTPPARTVATFVAADVASVDAIATQVSPNDYSVASLATALVTSLLYVEMEVLVA